MVRPRASDRNLTVAVAFGKMVTCELEDDFRTEGSGALVLCNGRFNIHSVFSLCLPTCSRDSLAKHPQSRFGVSSIELNKALKQTGLRFVLFKSHIVCNNLVQVINIK
jgi:hypothetical protein